MKVLGRQDRSEHRAVMITTVLAAAAFGLFGLAWTGRCPLAATGSVATATPTSAPAETPAATQADPGDQAEHAETVWLTDFDRAFAMAERLDRPVLVDFAASWCVPCQMMEKHVWPQDKVREVLRDEVVPLKVDMDSAGARSLAQRYSVQFVPTLPDPFCEACGEKRLIPSCASRVASAMQT